MAPGLLLNFLDFRLDCLRAGFKQDFRSSRDCVQERDYGAQYRHMLDPCFLQLMCLVPGTS